MTDFMNPNQNPPKVLSGADIIKVVKMAKGKEKKVEKPRKCWRPEISGRRIDIVQDNVKKIKHWLVSFKWRF